MLFILISCSCYEVVRHLVENKKRGPGHFRRLPKGLVRRWTKKHVTQYCFLVDGGQSWDITRKSFFNFPKLNAERDQKSIEWMNESKYKKHGTHKESEKMKKWRRHSVIRSIGKNSMQNFSSQHEQIDHDIADLQENEEIKRTHIEWVMIESSVWYGRRDQQPACEWNAMDFEFVHVRMANDECEVKSKRVETQWKFEEFSFLFHDEFFFFVFLFFFLFVSNLYFHL